MGALFPPMAQQEILEETGLLSGCSVSGIFFEGLVGQIPRKKPGGKRK